jgi:hypothetical protein
VGFSQDSVKGEFRNGTNLNDAIDALKAGGTSAAEKFPPIRLFEFDDTSRRCWHGSSHARSVLGQRHRGEPL